MAEVRFADSINEFPNTHLLLVVLRNDNGWLGIELDVAGAAHLLYTPSELIRPNTDLFSERQALLLGAGAGRRSYMWMCFLFCSQKKRLNHDGELSLNG